MIKLLLLAVIQLPGAMHSIPHKCSAAGESGGKSSRPKICSNNTVLNHPGYLNYHSERMEKICNIMVAGRHIFVTFVVCNELWIW